MTSRLTASVVLAILMAIPPLGVDGYEPPRIRSVADLRAAMYPVVGHWPCVLLLNATGSVGCSTREPVWATLQRCEDMGCVRSIGGDRTLLLPPAVFPRAMREYLDGTDPVTEGWRGRVKGMFVEVGDGAGINATELAGASFSPQPAYPQAELRPNDDPGTHQWNPHGFGATDRRFENFPVVLLDAEGTDLARTFASMNHDTKYVKPDRVSESNLPMESALSSKQRLGVPKVTEENSEYCLARRSCLPVGGFSVLATSPPTPRKGGEGALPGKTPFVLVSARLDASAMFHDVAHGANAAMSGLVVLLAAAEAYAAALRSVALITDPAITPAKRVVFAAFAAEDWGYAGSRRFLYELAKAGDEAGGDSGGENVGDVLGLGAVDAAIELSAIGLAHRRVPADVTSPAVFAHATPNGAGLVDDIIAAADGINVSPRRSTPGTPIPPSSTFSLLRRDGNVRAAVLAEYDDTYLDPFHGSAWDVGVEAVDPARMAAVAVVLAKTLINVGAGFPAGSAHAAAATGSVDAAAVEATTRELVACLVDPAVGFDCARAKALFAPATGAWMDKYAGVVPGLTRNHQNPLGKSDVQRFAWNFLANATADRDGDDGRSSFKPCVSQEECSLGASGDGGNEDGGNTDDEVCVGATGDGSRGFLGAQERLRSKRRRLIESSPASSRLGSDADGQGAEPGVCLRTSVRFVPALSHRLSFDATELIWHVGDVDPAEAALGGGEDPVWTESNWPGNIGVTAYVHEGDFRDWMIFFSGLTISVVSWVYLNRLNKWYESVEQSEWGRAPYNWIDTGPPPNDHNTRAAREAREDTPASAT